MIKMYEQVPQVYMNASRDFQYLSRLIDVVFNSIKHNIDGIYNLPNIPDNVALTELLALTLGFKIRRNYDKEQLAALVSILPSILKCKGTITAIDLVGKAIIKASGTPGTYLSKVEDNVLTIVLPKEQIDTNLFMDLLPYILPAGLSCRIIRRTVQASEIKTEMGFESAIRAVLTKDYQIARLYNAGASESPDFHNVLGVPSYIDSANAFRPNVGLTDNNIIPVLNLDIDDSENIVRPYQIKGVDKIYEEEQINE